LSNRPLNSEGISSHTPGSNQDQPMLLVLQTQINKIDLESAGSDANNSSSD
jgi:hypothetical protein